MRIAVLQFNLMRDGQVFPAGSVVDVPGEEAKQLVKAAPKEFQIVEETAPENASGAGDSDKELPPGVEGVAEEEMSGEKTLEEMTVAELKEVAKKAGIDIGKARTKQAIIDAITAEALERNEEEAGDEVDGLPGDAE
ncbi:MAG: hypothetical protein J5915_06220 [Acidaminococcaceae bacterium]|nr:hypothetical protein [Acidaminococcaceae bacterium]